MRSSAENGYAAIIGLFPKSPHDAGVIGTFVLVVPELAVLILSVPVGVVPHFPS